ncbi:hypothetical protein ACVXHB_29155 [Escherichia coli]
MIDINIQQPIHIVDVDVFSADDAALSVPKHLRRVPLSSFWLTGPVEKAT